MNMTVAQSTTQPSMSLLSRLLLRRDRNRAAAELPQLGEMSRAQFDELVLLANLNHGIVRGLEVFLEIADAQKDQLRSQWAESALASERGRIQTAVHYLQEICAAFETAGHDVAVIKSLGHWPDLGSDLDLYTNAHPRDILALMKRSFHAEIAPRSWGDRLANKWNFLIPGLPEAVEIHMGRLGQTGEQVLMASRLMRRTRVIAIDDAWFRVPSASDRIMISTLQRMYRHFYFRICDVIDTADLVESGALDYPELRRASEMGGIWPGVATFLVIVSDYVEAYRGKGLLLPSEVLAASRFGGDKITVRSRFLRFPLMPEGASLYTRQVTSTARRGDIPATLRLSLLPPLASAAALAYRVTGSDKGIW